jgi:micrococcal nuclease
MCNHSEEPRIGSLADAPFQPAVPGVCRGRVRLLIPAIALVFAPLGSVTPAETSSAKVVSVHDGDTITVLDAGRQTKVRLEGIDAPELRQPFGSKARDALAALTKGKTVGMIGGKPDRYGRTVARVEVDGQDVGHRLVSDGLAWHYTRYSRDAALAAAERVARETRRGLWVDARPVPPWDWRATEDNRRMLRR